MRRTFPTKKVAAIALVPATSAVVVGANAAPAAAATTTSQQVSFVDLGGNPHTCTFQMVRQYPFNGDNQLGQGGTTALTGSDAACGDAIAYISASWNDPDGLPVSTQENSDGASTTRRYAPIGSSFHTTHTVTYNNCDDTISTCTYTFVRTK